MTSVDDALIGWERTRFNHRSYLLTSPEGHAIEHTATQVIGTLCEEIRQLRAAADEVVHINTVHCADRDHEAAFEQYATEEPGTILKATDTLREWVRVADADGWGHPGWRERA